MTHEPFPIYMFHRVNDSGYMNTNGLSLSGEHCSESSFRKSLQFIKDQHTVLPLEEIAERKANNQTLPSDVAGITFDDGTKDFLHEAHPILQEYSLPATNFVMCYPLQGKVTTTFLMQVLTGDSDVGNQIYYEHMPDILSALDKKWYDVFMKGISVNKDFYLGEKTDEIKQVKYLLNFLMPEDQKETVVYDLLERIFPEANERSIAQKMFLTEPEIAYLANQELVSIGSHLISHNKLSALSEEQAVYEIQESKNILQEATGKPVNTIGYPVGGIDEVSEKVRQAVIDSYVGGCTLLSTQAELVTDMDSVHVMPRVHEAQIQRVYPSFSY